MYFVFFVISLSLFVKKLCSVFIISLPFVLMSKFSVLLRILEVSGAVLERKQLFVYVLVTSSGSSKPVPVIVICAFAVHVFAYPLLYFGIVSINIPSTVMVDAAAQAY